MVTNNRFGDKPTTFIFRNRYRILQLYRSRFESGTRGDRYT